MTLLLMIFSLDNLVPSTVVGVRRPHDVNSSGRFMLPGLMPYVGGLVELVFTVGPGRN